MAPLWFWITQFIEGLSAAHHRARALRELELMDQTTLNDVGMSRSKIVSLSHGDEAGRCAAY